MKTIPEIRQETEGLSDEELSDCYRQVEGRILAHRHMGKIVFATLGNETGEIQLFAREGDSIEFDTLKEARMGDHVYVQGFLMRTKTGELSFDVDHMYTNATPMHPFPARKVGLVDHDTRWRNRHLDMWVNPEVRDTLQKRSALVHSLRRILHNEGFTEVETPMLHPVASGALAKPFMTHHEALDHDFALRIAPELYLKRLIIGGFTKVFEIGKSFRNEGISPRHNPEFTMLEMYVTPGSDYMMKSYCCQLILDGLLEIGHAPFITPWYEHEIDWLSPWETIKIMDLPGKTPEEQYEYFEMNVEGSLINPTWVQGIPQSVSPLATGWDGYADRYELFIGGMEVANMYTEQNDPVAQRAAMEAQGQVDEDYLKALEYGMPPTGGLGIGIDRLVMLLTGNTNIREVIAFPTVKPI